MKRTVAVCLMAGAVLAMSTAAFATPVDSWNKTQTVNLTANTTDDLMWVQEYGWNPTDPSLYPGGSINDPITSATLTIVANGVYQYGSVPGQTGVTAPQIDTAYLWTGTDWLLLGNLNTSTTATGSSTTVFNLTPAQASLFQGSTGVWVDVWVTQYPVNYGDTVVSSKLEVKTDWTQPQGGNNGGTSPIPAPGAILLASMGAGLVSWLRARKSL